MLVIPKLNKMADTVYSQLIETISLLAIVRLQAKSINHMCSVDQSFLVMIRLKWWAENSLSHLEMTHHDIYLLKISWHANYCQAK